MLGDLGGVLVLACLRLLFVLIVLICELAMIVVLGGGCLCVLMVVYFVFRGYGYLPCGFAACVLYVCVGFGVSFRWCLSVGFWLCKSFCSGFWYGVVRYVGGFAWFIWSGWVVSCAVYFVVGLLSWVFAVLVCGDGCVTVGLGVVCSCCVL